MAWCKKCKGYVYKDGYHRCPPEWSIYYEDSGFEDDAWSIMANSAEEAACAWAEQYDCDGEYNIVRGHSMAVGVCRKGDPRSEIEWFVVSGEAVPKYYAQAMTMTKSTGQRPLPKRSGLMFDLTHSLHTHEAARLIGATKASARMIERAPEAKRLAAMPEHRRLARMAMDSWMASKETDHG